MARLRFWQQLSPPKLFVLSFFLLILAGSIGFKILPGLYTGDPLNWLDAIFTATSAVCVTGLIVVDTAVHFTVWGQAYILLLIQLGGLSMITFTSIIIISFGKRLSLRQEALFQRSAEIVPRIHYPNLVRDIIFFTFAAEFVGFVLLYVMWAPEMGTLGAVWPAVFHTISAFCNAGFSTFSDSLMGFQRYPAPLLVVMTLVVTGGIGFLTLEELKLWYNERRRNVSYRISAHSRIVLATTGVLLAFGWFAFGIFEWGKALGELPGGHRILNALFMSVTSRTAGFSTIDYELASDSTNFLTIILMFIGGSPGSMAGGIKTTTVALIVLIAWARIRGSLAVNVHFRTIPDETLQRAIGLLAVAATAITIAVLLLITSESGSSDRQDLFLHYLFEVVSAFNTVGLSMGVTEELSTFGRWLTVVLMFVGRVGPLAFAAALVARLHPVEKKFRYAHEDVVVG